jgi:L-iditol 2-dehydrogenase
MSSNCSESNSAGFPATQTTGQYLHGASDLRCESRELPPPGPDEVQVAIQATTLCGSDLHYFHRYRNGSIVVKEPLCLGHESSGRIVSLGSRASQVNSKLSVGDGVALEVGIPCSQCDLCDQGRYNICSGLCFRGSGSKYPHFQGTLQEFVNQPARWVHQLPDGISYETGALLEPLAMAVYAMRRSQATAVAAKERSCLVFGAGAVGLLCATTARVEGYDNIAMADIDPGRLRFALDRGFASASYQVTPKRGATNDETMQIAKQTAAELADCRWPDGDCVGRVAVTFECTGVESCLQSSIYASLVVSQCRRLCCLEHLSPHER